MADRARIRVTIDFETTLGDPDAYEGASTPEAKLAKDLEYIREDGDYLSQVLQVVPSTVNATGEIIERDESP